MNEHNYRFWQGTIWCLKYHKYLLWHNVGVLCKPTLNHNVKKYSITKSNWGLRDTERCYNIPEFENCIYNTKAKTDPLYRQDGILYFHEVFFQLYFCMLWSNWLYGAPAVCQKNDLVHLILSEKQIFGECRPTDMIITSEWSHDSLPDEGIFL